MTLFSVALVSSDPLAPVRAWGPLCLRLGRPVDPGGLSGGEPGAVVDPERSEAKRQLSVRCAGQPLRRGPGGEPWANELHPAGQRIEPISDVVALLAALLRHKVFAVGARNGVMMADGGIGELLTPEPAGGMGRWGWGNFIGSGTIRGRREAVLRQQHQVPRVDHLFLYDGGTWCGRAIRHATAQCTEGEWNELWPANRGQWYNHHTMRGGNRC